MARNDAVDSRASRGESAGCFGPPDRLFIQQIFPRLFFHSASSLLFSNHRPDIDRSFLLSVENTARSYPLFEPRIFLFTAPLLVPPRNPATSNLQGKLTARHFRLSRCTRRKKCREFRGIPRRSIGLHQFSSLSTTANLLPRHSCLLDGCSCAYN